MLSTALYGVSFGQTLVHETRLGIVSYASTASTVGALSDYHNYDQVQGGLASIRTTQEIDVNILAYVAVALSCTNLHDALRALQASEKLTKEAKTPTSRPRLIILIATAYMYV